MKPENDHSISELLNESRDMLRRFEALTKGDSTISADMQKATIESLEQVLEPASDAFFDLFVEDDARSVVAEFRPPAGGMPLELETIERALAARSVVHGLLWSEIHRALSECNLELKLQTGVVIARATEPVPFIPEHLVLEEKWKNPAAPPLAHGDFDFKAVSPFVMVQKDDLLVRRVPASYGAKGTDVLGRELPFSTQEHPALDRGEHVTDEAIGWQAEVDGRLVIEGNRVSVSPVLELDQGVDYRTGNVHFKGEVLIRGPISSGFVVEAGGSISGTETLDAFELKAGGDLSTPGGIIGNGLGRVEVGGAVSAKFLEHLYLLAQGDVLVESGSMNSVIKTKGRLVLGDKSVLAGGQVHALHGVEAHHIGTPTGPRTELFLGLDYQGMERILWFRERSRELHAQLKKVDAAIPYGGPRSKELMAAAKKLRLEIVELTESARTQLVELGQDEEASLVVRGTVYPGTLVEICHVQFLVNQQMTGVRFFLDKRKGLIGVETTTPSGTPSKKR